MIWNILISIVVLAGGLSFWFCEERDPISICRNWFWGTIVLIVIVFLVLLLIAVGKWVLASVGLY